MDDVENIGANGLAVASRAIEERRGEGLYEAEFARDALMMAKFGHGRFPNLTEATVRRLAEVQGLVDRPNSDTEEKGRIPHEIREPGDPIRETMTARFGWEWPYFGSVDATPLFVSAAIRAEMDRAGFLDETITQADAQQRPLTAAVGESVRWILHQMDTNPEGLIETEPASNQCWQVWADSPDAYHHVDGHLARGKVAAVEVQAYAYDALMGTADLLDKYPSLVEEMSGGRLDANELRERAKNLRQAVIDNFWVPGGHGNEFLAIGTERLDGILRPLAIRSINMGLVLNTRLLEGVEMSTYVEHIVTHLTDPSGGMIKPTGVVTLGPDSPRARPQAYHNGSIWPWTNYELAAGLSRHGLPGLAREIRARVDRDNQDLNCFPEKVQSGDSTNARMNDAIVYVVTPDGNGGTYEHQVMQPGQLYQGWTVFGSDFSQRAERDIEKGMAPARAVDPRSQRLEDRILTALHIDLPP